MEVKRKKYQGTFNILYFNQHFYIGGLLVLALVLISPLFQYWPAWLYPITIGSLLYALLIPLFVSAYIYDFSGYYTLDWLQMESLEHKEGKLLVNIHAGFDETSFTLQKKFPNSELKVFDFYQPLRHTEPAIIRARNRTMSYPGTAPINSTRIPLPDKSADLIFLLMAAHEIRNPEERVQFLSECHRVCRQDGEVILVEHLRDLPNFLTFSVGFTHFYSKQHWRNNLEKAGFSSIEQSRFTPFLSIFRCSP